MIVFHLAITTAEDYAAKREPHRRAHLERLQGLRAAGIVIGGGPAPDGRRVDIFYRLQQPGQVTPAVEEDPYFLAGAWTAYTPHSFTHFVEPFEKKYDARVEIVTGITTEWVAKLMAAGPDHPPFDVVMGNEPPLPIPRERGFFEKRNPAAAPNIKNVYDKALIGDTSLAIFWGRIGLA